MNIFKSYKTLKVEKRFFGDFQSKIFKDSMPFEKGSKMKTKMDLLPIIFEDLRSFVATLTCGPRDRDPG